jgi:hypothetical protein
MTIEFIHAKQYDANLLRTLFQSGRRHFQNGIQRIVRASLCHADELCDLARKKEFIGRGIGGVARVNEVIRDIGLVFNGGLVVDIGAISPEDLSQEISVRVLGDVVFRNTMTFLPGAVCRKYRDVSALRFMDSLLQKQDLLLSKSIKYSVNNDETDILAKSFVGGDVSWIANAIKRSSREVDEHILSTIHYLQGRRGK